MFENIKCTSLKAVVDLFAVAVAIAVASVIVIVISCSCCHFHRSYHFWAVASNESTYYSYTTNIKYGFNIKRSNLANFLIINFCASEQKRSDSSKTHTQRRQCLMGLYIGEAAYKMLFNVKPCENEHFIPSAECESSLFYTCIYVCWSCNNEFSIYNLFIFLPWI